MELTLTPENFLHILQIGSPSLPIGAYCYSEGLEMLVENGTINDSSTLRNWLTSELTYGAIRVDAAIIKRSYECIHIQDLENLQKWNHWLSAFRETEEMRAASWQMGNSFVSLLKNLIPESSDLLRFINSCQYPINYPIAYSFACSHWHIQIHTALLAYLHSWLTNLITSSVKLIPLGQTIGQVLLIELQPVLIQIVSEIDTMKDDDLYCCNWGLSLASMQHETQYSRLFRS